MHAHMCQGCNRKKGGGALVWAKCNIGSLYKVCNLASMRCPKRCMHTHVKAATEEIVTGACQGHSADRTRSVKFACMH